MKKLFRSFLIGSVFFHKVVSAQVPAPVEDQLFPASSVQMSGLVGQKLDDAYKNRILAQDARRLVAPFRDRNEDRCWQSEFWGKWFTSAVQAYRYRPEPALKAILDQSINELISTQTPDGYIGNYAPSKRLGQWDIWGRKYCMLGLLAYYDLTKDKKSLKAAEKLADHLSKELLEQHAKIVEKGNYRGMAASSVLEPITQLYVRTHKEKYLLFAEKIVEQWELPVGPQLISKSNIAVAKRFPFPKAEEWASQGQKAYEMMSCYEGLLELYRITGNSSYKKVVENVWQNILDTEISIVGSGSASECWYGGKNSQQYVTMHSQETCVTVTWIKLGQQLLRLTGDVKYADAIEKSYYNALLGSMRPDGSDWGMYTPIMGIRSGGSNQCEMGLNCCVASGPRGLFTLPLTAVMTSRDGLSVNFFNEGSYEVATPSGKFVELVQETAYPLTGKVNMQVKLAKSERFTVKIRIPAWSKETRLTVNDKLVTDVKEGEYLSITRLWTAKDKIELELDMRGRVETIQGRPSWLAIQRGPVILARDLRLAGDVDVDETITPVLTNDGYIPLEKVASDGAGNIAMSFKIPCLVGSWRLGENAKPVDLVFCDYASAGNTFSPASRYRIWFQQLLDATQLVSD